MWPGEQPPTSGQNAPNNPYRQPGYHQPNPYLTQQRPQPPTGGGGRTKVVAITAAVAVVVAAGVTGALLIGGADGATPVPTTSPTTSASAAPRSGGGPKPTVSGWRVVANPDTKIAFDVPPEWAPKSTGWVTYAVRDGNEDDILIAMKAPAVLKEKWCASDTDRDGTVDYVPLADTGSRKNDGARSPRQIARNDSAEWVFGFYTQPDLKKVEIGAVTSYTTASGITGSVATSQSSGVVRKDRCDSDGKATTFAFKDPDGDLVSWSFVGAKGVEGEVPDATVRRILSTVRLYDVPAG
ncbi:hypothetical protein [Streptomyces sp. NPDC091217]|uniref:hypothetical protein n=1 Tax=Streptomyces sp. NPDC091217 TaxID=3365975 RepID=UPI003817F7BE